ncbi:MAG: tRNA (N6-threonylcarbamoyladenosine(37)-N6)-methyltransferase TrmO, partial [Bacteroidales bacterium]|nr:tRNA (N6-threonylcarbamoyladenosine(37)-N6)-methyltransferase TrmO [Bacteroidales bacterium]
MKNILQIAHISTDFKEKFGIPRQSGMVESAVGRIVFEEKYRQSDAIRGMEGFSHIWLIWGFSEASSRDGDEFCATVRPPRLGGNTRVGVFASRSPFRPNGLAISAVKIDHIDYNSADAPAIIVRGVDLLDGTPIY